VFVVLLVLMYFYVYCWCFHMYLNIFYIEYCVFLVVDISSYFGLCFLFVFIIYLFIYGGHGLCPYLCCIMCSQLFLVVLYVL